MNWYNFLLLLPLILILISMIVFLILWQWSLIVTRAPFVPIPKAVLPAIISALALTPTSRLYDLGCGDGRVLIACSQRLPTATYIGLDKDLVPVWLAGWRLWRLKKTHHITILRKNFFAHNLSDATHIFTYLFPKLMDDLLPKLIQELPSGARLVSCDFKFTDRDPIAVIDLKRPRRALAHSLYIYTF